MCIRISLALVVTTLLAGCVSGGRYTLQPTTVSGDQQALAQQLDVGIRDQLARCGGTEKGTITLQPRLDVTPDAMSLHMLGVRSVDQQVLGNFSLRAAGSTREKQIKGLVSRVCAEAGAIQQ